MKIDGLLHDAKAISGSRLRHQPIWLAENFIRKGDIVAIEGLSGVGVTWFAAALGIQLNKGNEVFGRFPCPEALPVVYCEGSMSEEEMASRLDSLCFDDKKKPFHLISFSSVMQGGGGSFPTFEDPALRDEVIQLAKKQPSLIIFDNMASLFRPLPGDKSGDPLPFLLELRKAEATLVLCSPKGNKSATILENYIDLKIGLTNKSDSKEWLIRADILKGRHLAPIYQVPFIVELEGGETGEILTGNREIDDKPQIQAVIAALRGQTQADIAKQLGRNQSTVSRWLKEQECAGRIQRPGQVVNITKIGRQWLKGEGIDLGLIGV